MSINAGNQAMMMIRLNRDGRNCCREANSRLPLYCTTMDGTSGNVAGRKLFQRPSNRDEAEQVRGENNWKPDGRAQV